MNYWSIDVPRGEGVKFKTVKNSSKAVAGNFAKFCTSKNLARGIIICNV
jgi:hypothetical protein